VSALWPVQVALAARLNAWPALVARGVRFHDGQAPQGVPMPYGVIGEPTEEPGDVLGAGYDSTFSLHVWSAKSGSSREAYEIAADMDAALAAPLAVTGFGTVTSKLDLRNLFIEDDGARHLWARYRFLSFGGAA
jgi:hypothetical protein